MKVVTKDNKTKVESVPGYRSVSQKIAAKKNPKRTYKRGK